jgi:hypothetical protein
MDISGLNALDPRVAATEKFISEKKIPPEQVPQFLMSMGADPRLAGLVMKYQRLKSAGQQGGNAQPPQTTVAQDIDAQSRQGIAAPMAPPPNREQGIANLPAPVMERAQFAGGGIVAFQEGGNEGLEAEEDLSKLGYGAARARISSLIKQAESAGDMQRAARLREQLATLSMSFSMPGVRAPGYMSEGARRSMGMPANEAAASTPPASATTPVNPAAVAAATPRKRDWANAPQQNRKTVEGTRPIPDFFSFAPPEERKTGATNAGMNLGTANEGIKLLEQQVRDLQKLKPEDREARYRAAGIEDMTPAQLKKIQERIDKLSGDKKRDAYLALAQAGFKMAAAASRPGATLLGALGEGAGEGTKMLSDINKEYRALQSDLEDKVMSLQRYQQQRREGQIDRDIEFEREIAKEIGEAQGKVAEAKTDAERFGVTTQLQREQIEASRERGGKVEEDLKKRIVFAKTQKERDEAMKLLADLRGVDVRILAEQLKAEAAAERDANRNSFGGLGGIGGVSTSAIDEELRRRGAE